MGPMGPQYRPLQCWLRKLFEMSCCQFLVEAQKNIDLLVYMGDSKNQGPKCGPQNSRALIIRTTKKGPPNFWKPPYDRDGSKAVIYIF